MSVDGVLLIDKEEGLTSHDVVERVRSILGMRRIGHTGTLDPMATGLLPLCLGKATPLSHLVRQDVRRHHPLRAGHRNP